MVHTRLMTCIIIIIIIVVIIINTVRMLDGLESCFLRTEAKRLKLSRGQKFVAESSDEIVSFDR